MSEEVRASQYNYMPARPRSTRSTKSSWEDKLQGILQDRAAILPHTQIAQQETKPDTVPNPAPNEPGDPTLRPPDTTRPSRVIFRYNTLHDMGSVLWLSPFVLLVSEYEKNELDDKGEHKYDAQTFQDFMDAQHALAWRLFCERDRVLVMTTTDYLMRQADGLHPTVCKIIGELNVMCSDLVDAFKDTEKDLKPGAAEPISKDKDWSAVNEQLSQSITNIISILRQTPLRLLKDITKSRRRLVNLKGGGGVVRGYAEVDRDSDADQDQDQDGRPVKIRRIDSVSSSLRIQPPTPLTTTIVPAGYGFGFE